MSREKKMARIYGKVRFVLVSFGLVCMLHSNSLGTFGETEAAPKVVDRAELRRQPRRSLDDFFRSGRDNI